MATAPSVSAADFASGISRKGGRQPGPLGRIKVWREGYVLYYSYVHLRFVCTVKPGWKAVFKFNASW
ncbi:Hypothetical predicted protein [Podarcis lilfordi]|uniref:Uncharacterized protein n=1 Tax=Podarcis lilfordi TaxID=74358 RepID=A0AA35JUF6_9SAUR|nr:Hypothetical predicted protein [Podarcis lilfordi]